MLTRRAKAYSSSCSQTVSILVVCTAAKDRKNQYNTHYFGSSGSFKVINVDMAKKLVTSVCCDRQHVHAYLQPSS